MLQMPGRQRLVQIPRARRCFENNQQMILIDLRGVDVKHTGFCSSCLSTGVVLILELDKSEQTKRDAG